MRDSPPSTRTPRNLEPGPTARTTRNMKPGTRTRNPEPGTLVPLLLLQVPPYHPPPFTLTNHPTPRSTLSHPLNRQLPGQERQGDLIAEPRTRNPTPPPLAPNANPTVSFAGTRVRTARRCGPLSLSLPPSERQLPCPSTPFLTLAPGRYKGKDGKVMWSRDPNPHLLKILI